jgi:hypothetical protein
MKNSYQMPTPEEIRRQCEEIRVGWTKQERLLRSKPKVLSIWLPRTHLWARVTNDVVTVEEFAAMARMS